MLAEAVAADTDFHNSSSVSPDAPHDPAARKIGTGLFYNYYKIESRFCQ
jgi:hypothetical protein